MKLTRLLAALVAAILLCSAAGCVRLTDQNGSPIQSSTSSEPKREQTQSEKFNAYLDECFDEVAGANLLDSRFLLRNPEKRGLTNIPKIVGSMNLEDEKNMAGQWQERYDELMAFDYDALTAEQQLTYDLMLYQLTLEKPVKELSYYYEPNGPLLGLQSSLPAMLSEFYMRTVQDAYDYIEMLGSVPAYFDEMLEYQRVRSEKGLFMSDTMADEVIKSCTNFADAPDNMLIATFENRISDLPGMTDPEKIKLMEQNEKAVTQQVIPAYNSFVEGIKALKGTGKNDKGMYYLPQGRKYYEYLLLSSTGSDRSATQMAELIDSHLSSWFQEMNSLFTKDEDIFQRYQQTEIIRSDPAENLELLRQRCATRFPELSALEYTVKYVDPSVEENSSPAYYFLPPVDAVAENSIYVNQSYYKDDKRGDLFTTMAHEGYPGHMYQFNYLASINPHPVRRFLGPLGYSEGWASYVELMACEMIGIDDPNIVWMLQFDNQVPLLLIARADIGVNYAGWDKAQLQAYLNQFGMGAPEAVDSVWASAIEKPGNAATYCLGVLEIQELRAHAENELTEDFDEVAFHKAVLDIGNAPFRFVRQAVDDYISAVKAQNAPKVAA